MAKTARILLFLLFVPRTEASSSRSSSVLKGSSPRANLRRHRILKQEKTPSPTASPTASPSLSPTASPSASPSYPPTPKPTDKKSKKEEEDDEDDDVVIVFDDDAIAFDDSVGSVSASASSAPSSAPSARTLSPTFEDDFLAYEATPTPETAGEETGEPPAPAQAPNGIGIGVDVGGNENVVDVTVIITQNGGEANAGGDSTEDGAEDDFLIDDFVDDDLSVSVSMSMAGGASVSMSMASGADAGGASGGHGPQETTASEDAATADGGEPSGEEMEVPEDVAAIQEDDDFAAFFGKKGEKPEKEDKR